MQMPDWGNSHKKKVKETEDSDMFCTQCGNQLSEGAKFCAKCGYKVPERTKAEVSGSSVTNTSETSKQDAGVEVKPKKKSKLWLWILLIILVLGLGATATVIYLHHVESMEEDEDEEDEDDDKDQDSDSDDEESLNQLGKYVDNSKKATTVQIIGNTMDLLEVLAVDPAVDWEIGEVVYVRFTAEGNEYGADKEDIVSDIEAILVEDLIVQTWYGFEIWAKKGENGWVEFATSWDYDEMAEISPAFANRFSMTSVQP